MTGIPTAEGSEAAKAALHANVENEAKRQTGSNIGDVAGNVAFEGVGEVVGAAVGALLEGMGTVATATGEAVVNAAGGIFDGLSS